MNKILTNVRNKTTASMKATGHKLGAITDVGVKVAFAALFGNSAGQALSLSAHDPVYDLKRMREASNLISDTEPQGGSIPDAELAKLFRAVGTAAWKLAGRMLDEETKDPKDEYRRLWRHVEAIHDALTAIGVDVIDWTGKRYDEGMSLKVVSEEERPGTKEPEIIETLLPTIRFRKQVQLQQGEVVVSKPAAITKDARSVGANDE